MTDNIDFLRLEMRLEIPSGDFKRFLNRNFGEADKDFPVNRVSVADNTRYFEILKTCGIFDLIKEEDVMASFGISTCYGMNGSGGVIFIPNAELVYAKQNVPFIVHSYVTDAESESRAMETIRCNSFNSHPETHHMISPDSAKYYIHINCPALEEKEIRAKYGRLCPILKED